MNEEQKKNWKIFAIGLIMLGISIQAYIMWNEGQKTAVTNTIMREGINAIGRYNG